MKITDVTALFNQRRSEDPRPDHDIVRDQNTGDIYDRFIPGRFVTGYSPLNFDYTLTVFNQSGTYVAHIYAHYGHAAITGCPFNSFAVSGIYRNDTEDDAVKKAQRRFSFERLAMIFGKIGEIGGIPKPIIVYVDISGRNERRNN